MKRNYSVQGLVDDTGRVPVYKILGSWGTLATAKAIKANHPDSEYIRIVDTMRKIVVG